MSRSILWHISKVNSVGVSGWCRATRSYGDTQLTSVDGAVDPPVRLECRRCHEQSEKVCPDRVYSCNTRSVLTLTTRDFATEWKAHFGPAGSRRGETPGYSAPPCRLACHRSRARRARALMKPRRMTGREPPGANCQYGGRLLIGAPLSIIVDTKSSSGVLFACRQFQLISYLLVPLSIDRRPQAADIEVGTRH